MEQFVLGIDAAWTSTEPSGIALLACNNSLATIVRAGRSYEEFCFRERPVWGESVKGSLPSFPSIISACRVSSGLDIVALDIPLSPNAIVGRREADNAISRYYGKFGAGTHSPSPIRPGAIASSIFDQLTGCGFQWYGLDAPFARSFIEVYPHVAIIELFQYQYRFPYKVEKRSRYWPALSSKERVRAIVKNLHELRSKLSSEISNLDPFLPELDPYTDYKTKYLKSYEDLLDAIVCALVGLRVMEGRAVPFGDETGVIWVPR